jgi:hypothetical protein
MFLHSKETKLVTDLADGSNPSTYTNSTTILLKAASDNKSLAELPVPFVITDWKPSTEVSFVPVLVLSSFEQETSIMIERVSSVITFSFFYFLN